MKEQCTLCAILVGKLDPNEVPLDYLQGSVARMVTHFVCHPSQGLAKSIERLCSAIAAHAQASSSTLGASHYVKLAQAWRSIVAQLDAQQSMPAHVAYVH